MTMNRTKLNIKMDLMRVAKIALDLKNSFDQSVANVFIDKAKSEFENNLHTETALKVELEQYQKQIPLVAQDNLQRLRWGEKVMTLASRLGTF